METQQEYIAKFEFTEQSKYVVMYTSLFTLASPMVPAQPFTSYFIGYNTEEIFLPSINPNTFTRFRILSVIIRHGATTNAGHYTIWVRHLKQNCWVHINDLGLTEYSHTLPNNLKNIKLWFLEK